MESQISKDIDELFKLLSLESNKEVVEKIRKDLSCIEDKQKRTAILQLSLLLVLARKGKYD